MDIIMKWNDLPEANTRKYLESKFDKTWSKCDVNGAGFIETTEAFQFERQLMGTFTSLTDGMDMGNLDSKSSAKVDLELDKLI